MKNKLAFVLLIIVLYFFNFFGRFYDLFFNFVITGFINFIFTYYLLKINPFKKVGLFLIFLPFFLMTFAIIHGVYNREILPGLSGYLMYITSTSFGILFFKSINKKYIILSYVFILTLFILNYNNFNNYYFSKFNVSSKINKKFPSIYVSEKSGSKFKIEAKGKILVIDLWSLSCGNCIKAFPKFEKLKEKFKNNNRIEFLSINIYNSFDEIQKSEKFLKSYTFKNYYSNSSLYKTLDFNTVPNYIIVDRDGYIKYLGSLNEGVFETYNNIHTLISNEK